MKKTLVLLLCLVMLLLCSACRIHIDTDPWPASPGYVDENVTVTPMPSEEPIITAAPVATDVPTAETVTPAPSLIEEPAETVTHAPNTNDGKDSTDANELSPIVTEVPVPNDTVVEPGFNG